MKNKTPVLTPQQKAQILGDAEDGQIVVEGVCWPKIGIGKMRDMEDGRPAVKVWDANGDSRLLPLKHHSIREARHALSKLVPGVRWIIA